MRYGSRLGVVALFFCFFLLTPAFVSAHAYIVRSSPQPNQSFSTAPPDVYIEFDESVQSVFDSLSVYNDQGSRVDQGDARVDTGNPKRLECSLKRGITDGSYTVHWKVISADGHPVSGVIPFVVGHPQAGQTAAASVTTYLPTPAVIALRWLFYMSAALYLGSVFFRSVIMPAELKHRSAVWGRFKRVLWLSWIGMTVAVILGLPLQITIDANVSWAEAVKPAMLQNMLVYTNFGHKWLLQLLVVLALVIATNLGLSRDDTKASYRSWIPACVLTAGLLVTRSMTSHAMAAQAPDIPVTADFLHLVAVSVWIGSLFGMVVFMPQRNTEMSAADEKKQLYWLTIRRFAPWGAASVGIIVLTGFYAALLNIPTMYALTHTLYGKTLLIKIGLFLLMAALGLYHFLRGQSDPSSGKTSRSRTIWVELLVGVLVVVAASVLTNLPTGKSDPGPFTGTQPLPKGGSATLRIDPNVTGQNTFDVEVKGSNGLPISDVQQLTLSFASLEMDMGAETVRVPPVAPGHFKVKGAYLSMAGRWQVHVHILTNSFQDEDTVFEVLTGALQ